MALTENIQRIEIWRCKLCDLEYYGDTLDEEDMDPDSITTFHDCKDGRKGLAVLVGFTKPFDPIEIEKITRSDINCLVLRSIRG
jgi:rubredoxin